MTTLEICVLLVYAYILLGVVAFGAIAVLAYCCGWLRPKQTPKQTRGLRAGYGRSRRSLRESPG